MTSARRKYTAADVSIRCAASVRLRDGSYAQCMRAKDKGYRFNPIPAVSGFCAQHAELFLMDKLEPNEFGSWRLKQD